VIEGNLVRTSANCGIDASWMRGAVGFRGWYVLAMIADLETAFMMELVMNVANSWDRPMPVMQPAHNDKSGVRAWEELLCLLFRS
jgi:hypothetical protein